MAEWQKILLTKDIVQQNREGVKPSLNFYKGEMDVPRKILKEDSTTHKILDALEDFLAEHNISINGIEYITIMGRSFTITDIDDGCTDLATLPRTFDTQKYVLIEKEE